MHPCDKPVFVILSVSQLIRCTSPQLSLTHIILGIAVVNQKRPNIGACATINKDAQFKNDQKVIE